MDRRRKAQQRKRIDMIGIAQNRDGKAKHGEAWKRKRKATQRTATEPKSDDTLRNGTESLRQDPKRNRRALTGNETEKQKYRAGGIRQKGR